LAGVLLRGDGSRALQDKRVLIVGASRGIGAAAAEAFVRNGARVVLGSRDLAALDDVARTLRTRGGDVRTKVADVADEASVHQLIDFTVESLGGLDVAVNNAGIALPRTRIGETAVEDFDRLMRVNSRGVFVAMKHEVNAMLSGGGAIVNVSSIGGLIGSAGRSSYVASKHALGGMTKSAALEYAKDNIRINAVAPGVTLTDLVKPRLQADPDLFDKMLAAVPMARCADPAEIANAIIWLASELASFVTGIILPVDGGFTVP
jgi:NAD(P)-dependent dehydrogenase (short-subunit alcohol dehydrogenase family)